MHASTSLLATSGCLRRTFCRSALNCTHGKRGNLKCACACLRVLVRACACLCLRSFAWGHNTCFINAAHFASPPPLHLSTHAHLERVVGLNGVNDILDARCHGFDLVELQEQLDWKVWSEQRRKHKGQSAIRKKKRGKRGRGEGGDKEDGRGGGRQGGGRRRRRDLQDKPPTHAHPSGSWSICFFIKPSRLRFASLK